MNYSLYQSKIPGVNALPVGLQLPTYIKPEPNKNLAKNNAVSAGPVELSLNRAVNFYADTGGCAFWRMGWPEYLLNCRQKANISNLGVMVTEGHFYRDIKAVKLQRQSTPNQRNFAKALKDSQKNFKYKLIYEVDDIIFAEDIPDYNVCKKPFVSNACKDSIIEIVNMMDEFTVTCEYMKQYYMHKTGFKNITVVPNYPPKFWIDRYYNKYNIEKSFSKNKKRPRVLYSGSGVHADVANALNQVDDFHHVVDAIIRARKDFKFVWKGCFPMRLKPYIDNGDMEFYPWDNLHDYPTGIINTGCNLTFASLIDSTFNRAKSNIKMLESGALGLPGVFQDMCTYKDAELKFTTGDELIDQLKYITRDTSTFMKYAEAARTYVEGMWLEDHLEEHYATYFTPFGSKERQYATTLIKNNPDQKA